MIIGLFFEKPTKLVKYNTLPINSFPTSGENGSGIHPKLIKVIASTSKQNQIINYKIMRILRNVRQIYASYT